MTVATARWQAVAALVDPVRRALFDHVRRQDHPVTREEAAAARGISRGLAAHHLDRLVEVGLLRARYQAPPHQPRGPGRAPKVYEPAGDEIALSIPERQYELAGQIFVDAIAEAPEEVRTAACRIAERVGRQLGELAAAHLGDATAAAGETAASADVTPRPAPDDTAPGAATAPDTSHAGAPGPTHTGAPDAMPASLRPRNTPAALDAVYQALDDLGFAPRRDAPARILLDNCPFHALATRQPEVVCATNHALITGLLDGLNATELSARLAPRPGACCVEITGTATSPERPAHQ